MRLIDADAINFRCAYNGVCSADEESCKNCSDYVCDFEDIQNQPTAYDVEAVVAELEKQVEQYDRRAEEHKDYEDYYSRYYSKARSYENAVEIVRGKE